MSAGQKNMSEARRRHVLGKGRTNSRYALFSAEQSGKIFNQGRQGLALKIFDALLYCHGSEGRGVTYLPRRRLRRESAGQPSRAGRPALARILGLPAPATGEKHEKCWTVTVQPRKLPQRPNFASIRTTCSAPRQSSLVLAIMPSLQRKIGAQKDLAELCYISALHQTGNDVRRDGSIRDVDVALYLRSRHNVLVSSCEVRKFILPGLAGTTCCSGDDVKVVDNTGANHGGGKLKGGSKANDDGVVDLAEQTALLMIPVLVKLAEEQKQLQGTADIADDFVDDESSSQQDISDEIPNSNIIGDALRIILNDIGSTCSEIYPELTPELLRNILTTYGEEAMATDDQLIKEMMGVALAAGTSTTVESVGMNDGNKVRLDPATFAHILTADLTLLRSSDETRISTNYQDVLDAAVPNDEHEIAKKKKEDVESGSVGTTTTSTFDLKRFRFNTSHIDFTGGRYASKAMVALLWASFIMFVFAELIVGGDLSAYVVSYYMFVKDNPCRFIAFHRQYRQSSRYLQSHFFRWQYLF